MTTDKKSMPHSIFIFEDVEPNLEDLKSPLKDILDEEDYKFEDFRGQESGPDDLDDTEYVKQLLEDEEGNYPLLVVLDAELNEYNASTVRRADVREACSELGIPICVYHRDEGEYSDPESIKESETKLSAWCHGMAAMLKWPSSAQLLLKDLKKSTNILKSEWLMRLLKSCWNPLQNLSKKLKMSR
jgi:hypothetical protein